MFLWEFFSGKFSSISFQFSGRKSPFQLAQHPFSKDSHPNTECATSFQFWMFFQFHLGLLPLNLLSILDPIILQRLQPKSKLSLQPYCIVVWNVIYLMQWRWWLTMISVPWIIFTFLSTSFLKTTLYIEVRSDRSVVGSGLLTRGATFIECWWRAHLFWGNKRLCSKKLCLKHFNEYFP